MRREPAIYAALVLAALALAFRAWTREDAAATPGSVEPWHEPADAIVALEYTRPGHRLLIRRVGPSDAPYLWATTDTSAFVVGADAGQRLLDALAAPRALRDLGVPGAPERRAFGLDTARTRLVIRFRDRSRELLVGDAAYLSGERYVLERGGHAYVLPADALMGLDGGAASLAERRMHLFPAERVAAVTVRAGGRTLDMRRLEAAESAPGAPAAGTPAAWAPAAAPERPDPAFAAFMLRLDGLSAMGYAAREDPRTMQPVLRVDYADRRGRPLGFLEILQRPGAGPRPDFFARTELTRVLVRLFPGAGENLTPPW